ncbi:MAG: hypothetical protein QOE15_706 [Acidimicrobiaceae bacterium]|nr:hypothetical protein [Acidimicrobiaceae bacterium]
MWIGRQSHVAVRAARPFPATPSRPKEQGCGHCQASLGGSIDSDVLLAVREDYLGTAKRISERQPLAHDDDRLGVDGVLDGCRDGNLVGRLLDALLRPFSFSTIWRHHFEHPAGASQRQ